jgi:hypothetical protein
MEAGPKMADLGAAGADRIGRQASGFFRAWRRWNWPLRVPPESLGMEG